MIKSQNTVLIGVLILRLNYAGRPAKRMTLVTWLMKFNKNPSSFQLTGNAT